MHRHERIDHLGRMIPYLFALGCARTWMTLTFATQSDPLPLYISPHALFDCVYALVGIACALSARSIAPLQEQRWTKPLALAAMLLSSLFVIGAGLQPSAVLVSAGAAVGAAGFCLLLLMNTEALVPLSLVRITLYMAASRFIAVPLSWLCEGFDPARMSFALLVLPVIAVACVSYAYRSTPPAARPKNTWREFSFPWKPIALLFLYAFAYGLREASLTAGAGIHSSLSTALIMGAVFVAVYFFSDKFSLSALYRSPLLLMACGLLLVPAEGFIGTVASGYLVSMSYTLVSLLVSLLLYDLSKRLGIAIVALSGIEKASSLFRVGGSWCADALVQSPLPAQTQDIVLTAAVVMLILAGTLLLLPEREIASKWGAHLTEAGKLSAERRREERLAERCTELAKQHRLSPREDEVLRLLAQGRTNAAIERELFIASGTLKAHVQHIYVKLGVHSRKELLGLFADACDTADGEGADDGAERR